MTIPDDKQQVFIDISQQAFFRLNNGKGNGKFYPISGIDIGGGNQNLQSVTDVGNTTDKDIEITDFTKGIILRTSDGTRGRITLQKDGDGSLRLLLTTL